MSALTVVVLCDTEEFETSDLSICKGVPQALLPVANEPLLWHVLRALEVAGCKHAILTCGAPDFKRIGEYLNQEWRNRALSCELVSVDETGSTADALRHVAKKITSDFMVLPCDLVSTASLPYLLAQHRVRDASLTLLLVQQETAPEKKKKRSETGDFIGLDDSRTRLLYLGNDEDPSEPIRLPKNLIKRFPRIHFTTNLDDAHCYIFQRWIIDFLLARDDITSVRYELVPYLVKKQFSSRARLCVKQTGCVCAVTGSGADSASGSPTPSTTNTVGSAEGGTTAPLAATTTTSTTIATTTLSGGGVALGGSSGSGSAMASVDDAGDAGASEGDTAHEGKRYRADVFKFVEADHLMECAKNMSTTSRLADDAIVCQAVTVSTGDIYCARVINVQAYLEANRNSPAFKAFFADKAMKLSRPPSDTSTPTSTSNSSSNNTPAPGTTAQPPPLNSSATSSEKQRFGALSLKDKKRILGLGSTCAESVLVGDRSSIKHSHVGENCVIGDGVTISNSVIMAGVTIGNKCTIESSLVCNGATVGERTTLKQCQVQSEYAVEEDTRAKGDRLEDFDLDDGE